MLAAVTLFAILTTSVAAEDVISEEVTRSLRVSNTPNAAQTSTSVNRNLRSEAAMVAFDKITTDLLTLDHLKEITLIETTSQAQIAFNTIVYAFCKKVVPSASFKIWVQTMHSSFTKHVEDALYTALKQKFSDIEIAKILDGAFVLRGDKLTKLRIKALLKRHVKTWLTTESKSDIMKKLAELKSSKQRERLVQHLFAA